MEPLNKVGRAMDKPIEKLLPGTAKKFEKDVFGNIIKHPAKISTGLRNAGVVGGIGYYLHNKGEENKKEQETKMVGGIDTMIEKLKTDDNLTADDVM
jgi:hypothetical protein